MKIIKDKDLNIEEIVKTLENGGLVAYPTETMYGIGADATNSEAIRRLSEYKQRPMGKPYSITVADQKMAEEYVDLNQAGKNLYKNFLPGPMTVISKARKNKLAVGVASEQGTVGIRISSYPLVTEIVRALGGPITATSANASYKKRPYKINDILENISDKQRELIDLIIDAGELPHNEPSTVVDTTPDDPVVVRQGEIVLRDEVWVMSRSEEETRNVGKELWQKYEQYSGKRPIIFALVGPMGVGKTQFTKGLAKAMGIEEEIISPTYSLENKYLTPIPSPNLGEGKRITLSHLDAWRMQSPDELEQLGLKGMISDKSVLAIEWADRVAQVIRKYNEEAVIVWVKTDYCEKANERKISWGVI